MVVEVDGGTHGDPNEIAADLVRTDTLAKLGYKVFRANNRDVYDNIDGVLEHIVAVLEGRDR